jgi:alkanesulfonate monooxygenase SsuD/methylene tetrahydromethanopterin reductase-like flavin-dependent oxidoreductase (luciferase family)
MADYLQELQFGIFPTPNAKDAKQVLDLADAADETGLDLVTVQDHPYLGRFLDAWTLLSVIAGRTSRVRLSPNVACLPLRPPPVLARSVATLDILSGGRAELALGTGAFWDGIAGLGGRRLQPGDSISALSEAISLIRALWDTSSPTVDQDGSFYSVSGAQTGPAPVHRVEIAVGAYKPRMLRLTGRSADGWLPSQGYAGPDTVPGMSEILDEAAESAGRNPAEIRRMYNIKGTFGTGSDFLTGRAQDWAEQLADLTLRTGMSTYILATDSVEQVRTFASEVAPAARELVAAERAGAAR